MYYEEKFINGLLMFRTMPDAKWELKATSVATVVNAVKALTLEERMEVFGYFCHGCGTSDLSCYCQNDE